ncbi:hypothetical protein IIA16_00245 [bacterium]|nr:hypothetical protein [bacterium]
MTTRWGLLGALVLFALGLPSCNPRPTWTRAGVFTQPPEYLVTITSGRNLVVWDMQERPVKLYSWDKANVRSIAAVPDGGGVLAATDRGVFLFKGDNLASPGQLSHPDNPLTVIAWVPGSRTFLTGGEKGRVTAWEMAELGNIPRLLWAHEGDVTSIAVSANGTMVASGDEDGFVKVGPLPAKPQGEGGSPVVAVGREKKAKPGIASGDLLDPGAALEFSFPGDIRNLALNPSGTALLVVFYTGYFLERWLVKLTEPVGSRLFLASTSSGVAFVTDQDLVHDSEGVYRVQLDEDFAFKTMFGLSACDAQENLTLIPSRALVATSGMRRKTCLVDLNATPDNPGRTTRLPVTSQFVVASANGEWIAAIDGDRITVLEVDAVLKEPSQSNPAR